MRWDLPGQGELVERYSRATTQELKGELRGFIHPLWHDAFFKKNTKGWSRTGEHQQAINTVLLSRGEEV